MMDDNLDREQLEREGWKCSAVSTEAKLENLLREHERLGFEVYLERILPVVVDPDDGCGPHCGVTCTVCYDGPEGPSYRIYIRQKAER